MLICTYFRGNHVHSRLIPISDQIVPYMEEFGVVCKEQDIRNSINAYFNLLESDNCFRCDICQESPFTMIFDGNAKL